MENLFTRLANPFPSPLAFNLGMLFFRIAVGLEMIFVHGFKKIGIGVAEAEDIPNPLHLPEILNNSFAISANIFFPALVLVGFCTRLATLPTLAVTLTGYLVLHWQDAALIKDTPYIYSVVFLLILFLGPGKYSIDYYLHKKLSQ